MIVTDHSSTYRFTGWLEIDVSDSLKDFPFDFADLRICIRPRTLTWDKVKLDIWQGGQFLNIPHEASKNLDLLGSNRFAPKKTEWKLVGHRVELLKNDPRIYESSKAVIQSEYHILIMMQRDSSWYIWNVMLLEFMMVVLTILAMIFPLEPPPAPAKGATAASLPSSHMQVHMTAQTVVKIALTVSMAQVAITVLLALIMTQFGMKRHTPRVKEAVCVTKKQTLHYALPSFRHFWSITQICQLVLSLLLSFTRQSLNGEKRKLFIAILHFDFQATSTFVIVVVFQATSKNWPCRDD